MVNQILVLLLVFGALLSAWRAFAPGSGRGFNIIRQTDAAHLLMNAGMAVMFTAWHGRLWAAGISLLYGMMALGFLLALGLEFLRTHVDRKARLGTYFYHFIATMAMLYLIWLMQAAPQPMAAMSGMVMPATHTHPPLLAEMIGIAFALDGLLTVIVVVFSPTLAASATALAGEAASTTPGALRIAAVPHVIMDLGMAAMVLAML